MSKLNLYSEQDCKDFISSVLLKQYATRGDGPDEYDCFGLLKASYRALDKIDIELDFGHPNDNMDDHDGLTLMVDANSHRMVQVDGPLPGSMFVVRKKRLVVHVGRILQVGGTCYAVHAVATDLGRRRGVVAAEKMSKLKSRYEKVELEFYYYA